MGELPHPVEDSVHARYDVDAVDDDVIGARRPQCHVQHRAFLGHVDLVAPEHRLDPFGETGPSSQREQ